MNYWAKFKLANTTHRNNKKYGRAISSYERYYELRLRQTKIDNLGVCLCVYRVGLCRLRSEKKNDNKQKTTFACVQIVSRYESIEYSDLK